METNERKNEDSILGQGIFPNPTNSGTNPAFKNHIGQTYPHRIESAYSGKKVAPFDIIVHYLKSQKDIQELEKRVAAIHAQAVIKSIQRMTCPQEQKKQWSMPIE